MTTPRERCLIFLIIMLIIRNIDGGKCNYYDHPYHVQLDNLCGGSLLTRKYVLTSAVCCKGKGIITVKSGYITSKTFNQERASESIFIHPKFTWNSIIGLYSPYSYCLIKLTDPFEMNKYTKQIALAQASDLKLLKFLPKLNVTVMGHGHSILNPDNEHVTEYGENYQCATVTLSTKGECQTVAKPAHLKFDANTDFCYMTPVTKVGDTGAPVVYNDLQIGIVSGEINQTVTFLARVDVAFNWIDALKTEGVASIQLVVNQYEILGMLFILFMCNTAF